jgi:uncharacterized coiled-coil protein SlyX
MADINQQDPLDLEERVKQLEVELKKTKDYQEYLVENLNNSIKYTEYLAKKLDDLYIRFERF